MTWCNVCDHGFCAGNARIAAGGLPTIRPFALPHKRFVKQAVCARSKDYLGRDVSYREPWPLPAHKYRSQERRRVLQQATRGIVVDQMFQRLFSEQIFPRFATAHGWR